MGQTNVVIIVKGPFNLKGLITTIPITDKGIIEAHMWKEEDHPMLIGSILVAEALVMEEEIHFTAHFAIELVTHKINVLAKHGPPTKGSANTTVKTRENDRLFLSSFITHEEEDDNWYIDSSCSTHMAHKQSIF